MVHNQNTYLGMFLRAYHGWSLKYVAFVILVLAYYRFLNLNSNSILLLVRYLKKIRSKKSLKQKCNAANSINKIFCLEKKSV